MIIEDDNDLGSALADGLCAEGFDVIHVADGDSGMTRALNCHDLDLVITDYQLPGTGGLEILEQLREARKNIPVIMMTGHGTSKLAIESTRLGAFDYLLKPFGMAEFLSLVRRALGTARLTRSQVHLKFYEEELEGDFLIGRSSAMQLVFKEIGKLADREIGVLICGETGTGKELVARALFQHSHRSDKPFIAINCAAVPSNLLESELFGHEKGAFTGAVTRRLGRFEQADGGTLFLDEIGEMPLETQAKLLRVLQEKQIRRVGGSSEIPVDTRIISATNRNLRDEVRKGRFRDDLLYRLNSASILVPPLRKRDDDILRLANFYLRRYAADFRLPEVPGFEPGADAVLLSYSWPGNVRQLQNVVRSVLLDAKGFVLSKKLIELHLPASIDAAPESAARSGSQRELEVRDIAVWMLSKCEQNSTLTDTLDELERESLVLALDRLRGNQTAAAKHLGISRTMIVRRIRQFGLNDSESNQ